MDGLVTLKQPSLSSLKKGKKVLTVSVKMADASGGFSRSGVCRSTSNAFFPYFEGRDVVVFKTEDLRSCRSYDCVAAIFFLQILLTTYSRTCGLRASHLLVRHGYKIRAAFELCRNGRNVVTSRERFLYFVTALTCS